MLPKEVAIAEEIFTTSLVENDFRVAFALDTQANPSGQVCLEQRRYHIFVGPLSSQDKVDACRSGEGADPLQGSLSNSLRFAGSAIRSANSSKTTTIRGNASLPVS